MKLMLTSTNEIISDTSNFEQTNVEEDKPLNVLLKIEKKLLI